MHCFSNWLIPLVLTMLSRGADSKAGGGLSTRGKEWRLLCRRSPLFRTSSSGWRLDGGRCGSKAMLLFGSVAALCLAVVHQASLVEAGGTVPPKWPGPTIFSSDKGRVLNSRMSKCLEPLLENRPNVETRIVSLGGTCYIAPILGRPNGLKSLLESLAFEDSHCRRFRDKRYQSVLWNEALLVLLKKNKLGISRCSDHDGSWSLEGDSRGMIVLSLFWDYALSILRRPRISRIFSLLSGSRITRSIRNFFVWSFPAKFKKLLSDSELSPNAALIDDESQSDVQALYAASCETVKARNLGSLFVDRVRSYTTVDEDDDVLRDY